MKVDDHLDRRIGLQDRLNIRSRQIVGLVPVQFPVDHIVDLRVVEHFKAVLIRENLF